MYITVLLMDDLIRDNVHVGHLPRRFPSPVPVDTIGYIPHKTNWIRCRFLSYNFSFILSGGGEYWIGDVCWRVQAPCVLTQAPKTLQEYGPGGEWREWEELYFNYDGTKVSALDQMGLIRHDTPVWNIKDPGPIHARLQELKQVAAERQREGMADRIDRLCELMVMESILGETLKPTTPEERAILAIRDQVALHFTQRHDFHALARTHGLSDSTFRRYWSAWVRLPPARYLMRLRITEACRLLVETRLTVGAIAQASGFNDPLYFYRRFRVETGVTASEYRRNHQSPLSVVTQTQRTAYGQ